MTTFRSVLRTMEASAKRAQREAVRNQRALVKQQNQLDKLREQERAAYEVELYENELEILQSMHKDCSDKIDWLEVSEMDSPFEPVRQDGYELSAKEKLNNYKPKFFEKLFNKVDKIKYSLKEEIENAKLKDDETFHDNIKKYEKDKKEWEESVVTAKKILAGDLSTYKEVIEKLKPFSEISELGTSLSISFPSKDLVIIEFNVHPDESIPKEIKTLLKSGKISVKSMPKGRFNEIYQDHICSSILRIARESFAILPIQKVGVNALGNILNTQTGFKEDMSILSVLIPKVTLNKLNLDRIDPSDSMSNFVNKMNFKKTTGFTVIEKIIFDEYK